MNNERAIFLDRDGTLSRDVGYPADWSQLHIYPFAFEAVRRLRQAGLAPVVITDQSGVGRGFFSEDGLRVLHQEFSAAFEKQGAPIDGIYYCPHYSPGAGEGGRGGCACAKPNPGLGLRAAAELGLELPGSYMVGDKPCDILFGLGIGAVPVLVLTGYGRLSLADLRRRGIRPGHVAEDLAAAADWIVSREERARGPVRTARVRNGARP
jgi:D-glycero-D-manno-heptose 1,7-bisphosphate phosphatase